MPLDIFHAMLFEEKNAYTCWLLNRINIISEINNNLVFKYLLEKTHLTQSTFRLNSINGKINVFLKVLSLKIFLFSKVVI